MKIISWNVNGIRAWYKRGVSPFFVAHQPDIFCIQESKAHVDQVEEAARKLGFEYAYWSSAKRKGYSGVATFVNEEPAQCEKGIGLEEYDQEGRFVVSCHEHFDLYNIYFPNGGSGEVRHEFKQRFLADLNKHLAKELKQGKSIVVVGDYNVAHKPIDVYDPVRLSQVSGFLPEEQKWFDSFLDLGFVDTFRYFNPDAQDRYTWWSYRERARVMNRGWRIDYICISKDLLPHLKSANILDDVQGSDHCPVVAELEF